MGRKDDIIERVRAIAEPLAVQEGLELVEVQVGGSGRTELILFIDKLPNAPVAPALAANMPPASDAALLSASPQEPEPVPLHAAELEQDPDALEAGGELEVISLEPGDVRKPGVTLEDCANFSRIVSTALDVEDPLDGSYELVVSSPGLDRPLRLPAHYERYKGKRAKVKTYAPVPDCGNRKTFIGTLLGFDDEKNAVLIDVDGTKFAIPRPAISKANLDPVFDI